MRWAGHVASMGESRGACRIMMGRHGGRRPFDRRRHRLDDDIKIKNGKVYPCTGTEAL